MPGLDVLRAAALLGMLADHLLLVLGEGWSVDVARLTLTRPVMPVFVLLAGALAAERSGAARRPSRRHVQVLGVAMLAQVLVSSVLGEWPGILMLFAVLLPVAWLPPAGLLVAAVLGYVQAFYWPAHLWWPLWTGYDPGSIVLWLAVGALARSAIFAAADRLPAPSWLAWLGRRPLTFYVGHLLVLQVLTLGADNSWQ